MPLTTAFLKFLVSCACPSSNVYRSVSLVSESLSSLTSFSSGIACASQVFDDFSESNTGTWFLVYTSFRKTPPNQCQRPITFAWPPSISVFRTIFSTATHLHILISPSISVIPTIFNAIINGWCTQLFLIYIPLTIMTALIFSSVKGNSRSSCFWRSKRTCIRSSTSFSLSWRFMFCQDALNYIIYLMDENTSARLTHIPTSIIICSTVDINTSYLSRTLPKAAREMTL